LYHERVLSGNLERKKPVGRVGGWGVYWVEMVGEKKKLGGRRV